MSKTNMTKANAKKIVATLSVEQRQDAYVTAQAGWERHPEATGLKVLPFVPPWSRVRVEALLVTMGA